MRLEALLGPDEARAMPFVRLISNSAAPSREVQAGLLGTLSKLLSRELGKPEQWVMTCLEAPAAMTFAGSDAPTLYVEVKNIGTLTPDQTQRLSHAIMRETSSALGVPPARTYIEFADAVPHLWGWNGETFA
jgi:phenylpyruvate tautomerase